MISQNVRIPIIRLYGNVIVPVQVGLTDELVRQLKDDVTREIERVGAAGLVLDLTGADAMDSYITGAIRDLSLMARLMGVRTVISSLAPTIAVTLVEMGMELSGVATALNLEAALEMLRAPEDATEPTVLLEALAG